MSNKGEYEDGCKYGEDDCPAKPIEEPTMITDWLAEHGDPEIYKKVEKQLELEEAARDYIKGDDLSTFSQRAFFIAGAKWQQKRSYSEEDMIAFALFLEIHLPMKPRKTHHQLLEQFKKEIR